jgi:single stranded DNA-binding protein
MFSNINTFAVHGRLGSEPKEYKGENSPVVSARMATTVAGRNKEGRCEHQLWFNLLVFGQLGELMMKYGKSGRQIFVTGSIQASLYKDKEGQDSENLAILVNGFYVLPEAKRQSQVDEEKKTPELPLNIFE